MENTLVVLDDGDYALKLMTPLQSESHPSQWILLLCPPKLTRHAGRWLNKPALEAWRKRWAQEQVSKITQGLPGESARVQWRLAKDSLVEQVSKLQTEFKAPRVLDARRPRFGQDQAPVTQDQPIDASTQWAIPGAAATMGVALMLATD